jgi:hypothetical protein
MVIIYLGRRIDDMCNGACVPAWKFNMVHCKCVCPKEYQKKFIDIKNWIVLVPTCLY